MIPLTVEIWKDIEGYEGYYQVSDYGNVKGVERHVPHVLGGSHFIKERLLCLSKTKDGYFRINLTKNGVCKLFLVHRLVSITYVPNPNNYPCVNHKDGVKTHNWPINLEWCTRSHNNTHASKIGLRKNGAFKDRNNPHTSRLKRCQVVDILKRLKKGESHKLIAIDYGVKRPAITSINNGYTWSHVKISEELL